MDGMQIKAKIHKSVLSICDDAADIKSKLDRGSAQ